MMSRRECVLTTTTSSQVLAELILGTRRDLLSVRRQTRAEGRGLNELAAYLRASLQVDFSLGSDNGSSGCPATGRRWTL